MPRAALRLLALGAVLAAGGSPLAGLDPHLDASVMTDSCSTCHAGHGASRSPMLPGPQAEICLDCHESQAAADRMVAEGKLAPGSRPTTLGTVESQPFRHPIDEHAFSRHEAGVVTCSSCHSPHRGGRGLRLSSDNPGTRRASTLDPAMPEFELCDSCHRKDDMRAEDPRDIGGLLDPSNRSFHPVKTRSTDRSPSLVPELAGREINCTDCHGNSDAGGARGLHGSSVRHLLREEYTSLDGQSESAVAYALCYRCHERQAVLESPLFPEHYRHVVGESISCSSCHNPHGAADSRAMIRFDERPGIPAVSPSLRASRQAFESDVPGSGSCYLTCHGVDHGPESYGIAAGPPDFEGLPGFDAKKTGEERQIRKPRKKKR